MKFAISLAILLGLGAMPAVATTVLVEIHGTVAYNAVPGGLLADVEIGDPTLISFTVDSDDYVDSPQIGTRGYLIEQASYTTVLGSVNVGLQDPFPAGQAPYFGLRDETSQMEWDSFFLSTDATWPYGLPLQLDDGYLDYATQIYEAYFALGTLASRDILAAEGTYYTADSAGVLCKLVEASWDIIGIEVEFMAIILPVATSKASWTAVKSMYR